MGKITPSDRWRMWSPARKADLIVDTAFAGVGNLGLLAGVIVAASILGPLGLVGIVVLIASIAYSALKLWGRHYAPLLTGERPKELTSGG